VVAWIVLDPELALVDTGSVFDDSDGCLVSASVTAMAEPPIGINILAVEENMFINSFTPRSDIAQENRRID